LKADAVVNLREVPCHTSARMTSRPLLPPGTRRSLVVVSLASSVFGGVVAWSGWFDGLGRAAFGIGAAVTLILIYGFARTDPARRRPAFMLGYAFAIAVLTWPILWLVVGYARYLLTGQAIED
jgi:hypothetical protein